MRKKYYNWDKNGWEDEKDINKKKAKKNKEFNKLFLVVIGVFVLLGFMYFFNFTQQGKDISHKLLKKNYNVIVDTWDYNASNQDEAVSNFSMNDAQEDLSKQEDFVVPTSSPNENGKVSIPKIDNSEKIVIIENPEE